MMPNTPLTHLTDHDIHQLSDSLFSARQARKTLTTYPGVLPATLAQAYAVQDLSIAASPHQLIGWKVGMVAPELREQMQAERLMGPVFKHVTHLVGQSHTPDQRIAMPVFDKGFIAVEAELVMELAHDIAPGSVSSNEDYAAHVKAVYAGIEIASSPVPELNSYGPTAIASDFGNNHGMVVGAEIEDWQARINGMNTEVFINDVLINSAPADNVYKGPMAALAYLIDGAAQRGINLPAGTLVCSGAITGVHEAAVGDRSTVRFAGVGDLNIEFVAV